MPTECVQNFVERLKNQIMKQEVMEYRQICVRVPAHLINQVDALAKLTDISRTEFVNNLLFIGLESVLSEFDDETRAKFNAEIFDKEFPKP